MRLRGGSPEVRKLRIQRAPEGGSRSAAVQVCDEARVEFRGVWMETQHGCHHQITGAEVLSIQEGCVAQCVCQSVEFLGDELGGARPAQPRTFLILVDIVDNENI